MQNFWIFIIFMFVGGSILSFTLDGNSGLATSSLTAALTKSTTNIPIADTSGFPTSGGVIIDDEEFTYISIQTTATASCPVPSCLVVATRGNVNGTKATAHGSGARVYSRLAGLTNIAGGFRVSAFQDLGSVLDIPEAVGQVIGAIGSFVAKAIMWDYSFLEGNMVFMKFMLLYPLSGGFVIGVIQLIRGIL